MSKFKQALLTRFQRTDEGEVKEYLGGEIIRDRAARTGKMVQAGYAEISKVDFFWTHDLLVAS